MRIAHNREQIEGGPSISVSAALAELAKPKEQPALPVGGDNYDWMLAYVFSCVHPVPERFKRAMALMQECVAKKEYLDRAEYLRPPDDWQPAAEGDDVAARLRELRWVEREYNTGGVSSRTLAEMILLRNEVHQLVPELEDPNYRAGFERRSARVREMVSRAIEQLERNGGDPT
jgi:hypothetical protein